MVIMVSMKPLEQSEAEYAMDHGEFSPKIIESNENVVIVLTQGWCPQWAALKHMLAKLDFPNLNVFTFIYDRSPIFTEFMQFKESTYHNHEVPYLRYYKGGKLINTSNSVWKRRFLKNLN